MKCFTWDEAKNRRLKSERGVGFEDIVLYIERCTGLETIERSKQGRQYSQRAFVVSRHHVVYLVPFVDDDTSLFLQTIIPKQRSQYASDDHEPNKLDPGEKEVHDAFSRGDWRAVTVNRQERNRYIRYARATFRKDRRLNIRISSRDLEVIQQRAREEGLPYQTLISSVLHKFASGAS